MKGFCRILLACVALAPAARADVATKTTLVLAGHERAYYLLMPPIKEAVPLLVALHGSGGEGRQMIRRWQAMAEARSFAVLAPDALHSDAWSLTDDSPEILHAMIEDVRASHPIDSRRLYLTGQSGGAVYSLTLGMLESRYFAAVAVHAGAWRQDKEFAVMALAARKIPMSIVVGDRDEYFSLAAVEKTRSQLALHGFPAATTVIPHHFHDYDERTEEIDADLWGYLAPATLPDEPVYIDYGFGAKPGTGRSGF